MKARTAMSDPHQNPAVLPALCQAKFREILAKSFFWDRFLMRRKGASAAIERDDPIQIYLKNQALLWQRGLATWGLIVQSEGRLDHGRTGSGPVTLLHPANLQNTLHPDMLVSLAATYSRRETPLRFGSGESGAPAKQRFFGKPLPGSDSAEVPLAMTTTVLKRSEILHQPLRRYPYPILAMPEPPKTAMVLPFWTWPKAIFDYWQSFKSPPSFFGNAVEHFPASQVEVVAGYGGR